MRIFAFLALVIGLGLAGTAVYYASERFKNMQARLDNQTNVVAVETVKVAIAIREMRYGDKVSAEQFTFVDWPKIAAPPTAFSTVEALLGEEGEKPRYVIRLIEPYEPILSSKVTRFGQPAGMAQRLRPGMRAATIHVDVASGVSGFLTTGDRVDVLWTGQDQGQLISRFILEGVEIIAIDQRSDEDRSRAVVARTVTLEVTPKQNALLAQSSSTGRLSLSLRGTTDTEAVGSVQVDQFDVIGRSEEVKEPERVAPTVRVRRGSEVNVVPTE